MIDSIKENWLVWLVGFALFASIFAYGLFCFYCVQAAREQTASIQFVPINRMVERVITQSIDADGSVIKQSIKKIIRIRYTLAHSD